MWRRGRGWPAAAAGPGAGATPGARAGAAAHWPAGWWTWRSSRLTRARVEGAVLQMEPLGEDQARRGCRSLRAEAALLDGGDDHDRPGGVRDVDGVPGLVGVGGALGGAGLAVDGVREAAEDVRGGAAVLGG